jgi:protein-disulfide isomerase
MKSHLAILLVASSALPLAAQIAMPEKGATTVRNTSALKPPQGANVAIVEFSDLECPFCAMVAPTVHAAEVQYKVPLIQHDYLIPSHVWSRTAAISARYLEQKSPQLAEAFRLDVFANQRFISSPDDLQNFTAKWFTSHGQAMPFLIDPSRRCAIEVQADCDLAMRMGLLHTPTIFVVTSKEWIEVTDPKQLYAALDRAEADVRKVSPNPRR